jgi:DNA-binding transcriptional LysR family regulator
MDVETSRLRSFVNVAERGTVAAAAEALGYTAPAVSQHIAKLEQQVGRTLFDRVGGRLRLTAGGQELLPIAHQIIDLTGRLEERQRGAHARRTVAIAGFATALTELVVPLLGSPLTQRFALDVRESTDEEALRELSLGHLDLAIVQEYDGSPIARSNRLAYRRLYADKVRLVGPPSMAPTTTVADLVDSEWLLGGVSSKCQEATMIVLRRAAITPKVVGCVSDNQALLALVAAGHGVTIAPQLVVDVAKESVTVADEDLGIERSILAVTRAADAADLAELVDALSPALPVAGLRSRRAEQLRG